jgi:hypothetical protein
MLPVHEPPSAEPRLFVQRSVRTYLPTSSGRLFDWAIPKNESLTDAWKSAVFDTPTRVLVMAMMSVHGAGPVTVPSTLVKPLGQPLVAAVETVVTVNVALSVPVVGRNDSVPSVVAACAELRPAAITVPAARAATATALPRQVRRSVENIDEGPSST